jgi:hypothetical protein
VLSKQCSIDARVAPNWKERIKNPAPEPIVPNLRMCPEVEIIPVISYKYLVCRVQVQASQQPLLADMSSAGFDPSGTPHGTTPTPDCFPNDQVRAEFVWPRKVLEVS